MTKRVEIRDKKRYLKQRKKEELKSSKPFSCFWVWPWGHVYDSKPKYSRTRQAYWECLLCDRRKYEYSGPAIGG